MITTLELFLEQRALDLINEAVVHFSRKLTTALEKLEDDDESAIAASLLLLAGRHTEQDVTLIDIDTNQDGYFTFTTERAAKKKMEELFPDYGEHRIQYNYERKGRMSDIWDTAGSSLVEKPQSVRIGKLVNKFFPGKFSDKEREEFVLKLKATLERGAEKMLLVDAEDISYWYDGQNYYAKTGDLWHSCMKDDDFFEIYVQNPTVCKMLILVEQDKLKGRAIVWKVENQPFEWFMDRQYCNFDYDVEKFRNWAKKEGWGYRSKNNHWDFQNVTYNGEEVTREMTVKIKTGEYSTYPYMDTFKSLFTDSGTLHNKVLSSALVMQQTDGSAIHPGVWSDFLDRYIPDDFAIWSDYVRSYLDYRHANEVRVGRGRYHDWYPEETDFLKYSDYLSEWIHQNDATWCEFLGDYILDTLSEEMITDIDEELGYQISYMPDNYEHEEVSGDELWYKKLLKLHEDLRDKSVIAFVKGVLTKNYDSKLIPIRISVQVLSSSLLIPRHAKALGIEKKEGDKLVSIDLVEYNTMLKKKGYFHRLSQGKDWAVDEKYIYDGSESSD